MKPTSKRYFKIESFCDQCDEIHRHEGSAGIYAVLGKQLPGGGYAIDAGSLAINSETEMLNLVLSILRFVFNFMPHIMLAAMEHFMHDPGVAEAVMEQKMKVAALKSKLIQ